MALVDHGHSKSVEMGFYFNGCACANHGNKRGKGSPQQDYAGDVALLHRVNFDVFLLLAPLKTDDDDDAVSKIAASDPLVHWIGRTATGAEFGQSVLLMRSILIGKASRHLLTSRTTPGSRHRSATTVPAAPQAAARGGQSR